MMRFVRYTTGQADRWDMLSQRFYGSPYQYQRIIDNNPAVPIRPVLPPETVLAIPILSSTEAATITGLPPWKVGQ